MREPSVKGATLPCIVREGKAIAKAGEAGRTLKAMLRRQ